MDLALDLVERADREDPRSGQPRRGSAGRKVAGSTPQWMTSTLPAAVVAACRLEHGPVVVRDRHRERGLGDLGGSIVRSTWRSEPWAVNLYGIPIRRWTSQAGEGRMVREVAMHVVDALVAPSAATRGRPSGRCRARRGGSSGCARCPGSGRRRPAGSVDAADCRAGTSTGCARIGRRHERQVVGAVDAADRLRLHRARPSGAGAGTARCARPGPPSPRARTG